MHATKIFLIKDWTGTVLVFGLAWHIILASRPIQLSKGAESPEAFYANCKFGLSRMVFFQFSFQT